MPVIGAWLAIDDEGCVGVFDAGPGSVVPRDAFPGGRSTDRFPLDVLRAVRAIELGRHPPPTLATPGARALVVIDIARAAETSYRAGTRASAFEDAFRGHGLVVAREAEPRVVATVNALDMARRAVIDRDPTIVRALGERALAAWIDRERDTGVYRWTGADPQLPAHYRRVQTPTAPIHVHELPMETQLAIRVVRLPIRFARERDLLIDEHFEGAARSILLRSPDPPPRRTASSGVGEIGARTRDHRFAIAFAAAVAIHALLALLLRA